MAPGFGGGQRGSGRGGRIGRPAGSTHARGSRQGATRARQPTYRGRGKRTSRLNRLRGARSAAQQRLKRYRQASLLAVAMTGLFLLVTGSSEAAVQESAGDPAAAVVQEPAETQQGTGADGGALAPGALDSLAMDTTPADPAQAVEEATGSVRQFIGQLGEIMPKLLIAVALLLTAAVLVRLLRASLRRLLGQWEKADAATAMSAVLVWLIAVGAALSVLAGDARALIGSVGLLGLALSWALQAPIESFAGWLVNSFQGYYRVGDRIGVGDVFGDVYRIDSLTTTVWEAGGPGKAVEGAQPTGALITFPNSEVLRANVVNYTRFFPYVWDEVTVAVANESDLAYAVSVVREVAGRVVGPSMRGPVATYRQLLERERLAYDIADEPQIYVSGAESWTDITVRYLVAARERRKWSSMLHVEMAAEVARPEHGGRIVPAYPVRRVAVVQSDAQGLRPDGSD